MKEQIQLQDLHAHKNQPDRNGIEELAKSIRAIGLIEPIVVAPDGDKFAIIAGHRRVEAVRSLGFETIDAVILDSDNETLQTAALLASNTAREDFSEMQIGQVAQTLFDLGESAVFVSDVTGFSQKGVKAAAKLYKQAKESEQPEKYMAMTLEEADAMLSVADQPDLVEELEKMRGKPGFSHVAERCKQDAKVRRDEAALTAKLESEGIRVIPRPGWDEKTIIDLDKVGISEKNHKSCDGHAAYIYTGYSGTGHRLVCTDAKKYHDYKAVDRSPKDEAEAAERRRGNEFKKAGKAPTEVRRKWITEQLKTRKVWKGEWEYLAYTIANRNGHTTDLALQLAGVKRQSWQYSYGQSDPNFTPKTEAKAHKLALAMALAHDDEECRLSRGGDFHAVCVPQFLSFLKKNGYTLSEHEEQFLASMKGE